MQIDSVNDIWNAISEQIQSKMPEVSFNVWFKDLRLLEIKQDNLILGIYSEYKKGILESTYMNILCSCVKEVMGIDMNIQIEVADESGQILSHAATPANSTYEDTLTFDNFIVGSSNRFAHAASMAVADNPRIIYNPLVIY